MDVAATQVIRWTIRTIFPSVSHGEKQPCLRLLRVLIEDSRSSHKPELLTRYTNLLPIELNIGQDTETSRAVKYLLDQLAAQSNSTRDSRMLNFVLPYTSGYIIRSDFLQIRLQMLLKNHEICSFRKPLEYCEIKELETSLTDFMEILDTAVGVVSVTANEEIDRENLELQICDRLSYPWLSLHCISQRRVALVRGRPNYRVGGPVYTAAKALGVSLIIIDEDRHWLQADTQENKELREAFLTIDMKEDEDLPNRIATAIKHYPAEVDGLFTLSDNYLVAVAKTAELLGLPSSPSSAYEVAYDKGLTRQLHSAPHHYTNAKNEEDLDMHLDDGSFCPQYPLIVKPRTRGWNSQFVRKVRNNEELLQAVRDICPRYNDGVVIEPYYDGPEIDVNLVISGGEVTFQEIVDEPPSCGDLSDESSADFLENGMRAPSILPRQEQQIILDSISKTLQGLDFANGVFHVEARVTQSSMEFRDENGSIDLISTSPTRHEKVQCHLIEINARPPGLRAQILTQLTYGVDYFAAQIMSAVGDRGRLKALCQPFNLPNFPQGAQSWSQLVHLPVLSKGTTVGVAGIEKVLHELPDILPFVLEYQCCFEPGDALPDPAEHADFFGHCVVSSTQSRRHVVEIADEVLKAYHKIGVECTVAFDHSDQKSLVLNLDDEDQNILNQRITTKRNGGSGIMVVK